MPRVAILFDNFGPYHLARLTAAAGKCELLAIETARRSCEYAWDITSGRRRFQSECLFEGTSATLEAAPIAARLDTVLALFKPDVVAVPGWASATARGSAAWCLKRRVPLVVMSESQAIDEPRSGWREAAKQQMVGCYSAALVGGATHVDYLCQLGMQRDHVFLGYDAVDNAYFAKEAEEVRGQRSEVGRKQGLPERYFLASARFIEKKNLARLVQAYALYRRWTEDRKRRTERPWDLVLLGDGPLRVDLCRLTSDLSLRDSVVLPGFKQYPDLPAYYGLASAFVHASTTEPWGLVVNEAMASGLPVLVSNRCGCAPDLVQEGVNGFTFDPHNVEEITRLMSRLSTLNSQLTILGAASRAIISAWGPERFASGLNQAVECALRVGPAKPSSLQRTMLKALLWR